MKVKVDQEICIGCGLCVQMAPDVFKIEQDKAVAISEDLSLDQEEIAKDSARKCPIAAILIDPS